MNTSDKEFENAIRKLGPSERKDALRIMRYIAWRDHGKVDHPLDILRGAVLCFYLEFMHSIGKA